MLMLKKAAALFLVSALALALAAGCGDSNSPQAAVEEIVRAVRNGEAKTVEWRFANAGMLYMFEEMLPDACAPAIGKVDDPGSGTAAVEVLLNPMNPDGGGFTFALSKSGEAWKVTQVTLNEPQ